mmetsp:Transcript_696/g.847  ORF Transcript_696/g.847 Transcript_696/m.847 type:complete len:210 (-) Transcript_696:168-797(-)
MTAMKKTNPKESKWKMTLKDPCMISIKTGRTATKMEGETMRKKRKAMTNGLTNRWAMSAMMTRSWMSGCGMMRRTTRKRRERRSGRRKRRSTTRTPPLKWMTNRSWTMPRERMKKKTTGRKSPTTRPRRTRRTAKRKERRRKRSKRRRRQEMMRRMRITRMGRRMIMRRGKGRKKMKKGGSMTTMTINTKRKIMSSPRRRKRSWTSLTT